LNADRAAGILLVALGAFVIFQASRLPYWIDRSPGPGFLPLWLGVALVVCAAGVLIPSRAAAAPGPEPAADVDVRRRQMSVAIGLTSFTAIAAVLVPFIGFVTSTAVLTAGAAWWLDPRRRTAIAAAALLTPAIVWLIFVRWLSIPLP
jgi:putative tricarboxylic transport membrane protein